MSLATEIIWHEVFDDDTEGYFITSTGTSTGWNLSQGTFLDLTLVNSVTLINPTNMKAGGRYTLIARQDPTGSRVMSWDTVYLFPGGIAPVLSTAVNSVDIMEFRCDGIYMYGVANYSFS